MSIYATLYDLGIRRFRDDDGPAAIFLRPDGAVRRTYPSGEEPSES